MIPVGIISDVWNFSKFPWLEDLNSAFEIGQDSKSSKSDFPLFIPLKKLLWMSSTDDKSVKISTLNCTLDCLLFRFFVSSRSWIEIFSPILESGIELISQFSLSSPHFQIRKSVAAKMTWSVHWVSPQAFIFCSNSFIFRLSSGLILMKFFYIILITNRT